MKQSPFNNTNDPIFQPRSTSPVLHISLYLSYSIYPFDIDFTMAKRLNNREDEYDVDFEYPTPSPPFLLYFSRNPY